MPAKKRANKVRPYNKLLPDGTFLVIAVILSVSEESLCLHSLSADSRLIKPRDASHAFSMTMCTQYLFIPVI